ncbi:MAG: TPM domain-containing protein [Myxococcaceae bacterium]|nr:TPM domain-containing protein [Myxococcaceae bacterium]
MERALWCCGLLFVTSALAASGWDVPSPPTGRFVVDQTGSLRSDTVTQLEDLARTLDTSGRGQLGVLVLRTTAGEVPRRFATDVFNAWGIGHAGRDDGVLLFLALDDRKAELIVGTQEPLVKRQTDAIMANDIVANMKRRDPDGALLAAARSVVRELGAATPSPRAPSLPEPPPDVDERLAPYLRLEKPFPDRTPRTWVMDLTESLSASERADLEVLSNELYAEGRGRLLFLNVATDKSWPELGELVDLLQRQVEPTSSQPLAIVALNPRTLRGELRLPVRPSTEWEQRQVDAALEAMTAPRPTAGRLLLGGRFAALVLRTGIPPKPLEQVVRDVVHQFAAWLWGGLLAGLAGGAFWLRRWLRLRPRACETCHQPRERLSESDDDAHLSDGQQSEERLRSVDYDVWLCARCNDTLVLRYGAWFSGYSACSGCGFKTMSSSSTTLRAATQYSTGLVRVTETCNHCGKVSTSERVTAQLPRPSTSSSSSSSWTSSSSRSSGSFGGGRSSGGGSSGSW